MFKYKNALISVFDKSHLEQLSKFLIKKKFTIYSTGGTSEYLNKLGINFKEISKYTLQKEILGGRVKTLHPKIFGGLLANSDTKQQKELAMNKMINFDLLVVNLYPFEETLKKTSKYDEIIEMIDIGGHSLIRASVKNHSKVTTLINPDDYKEFEKSFYSIGKVNKKFAIKALVHANQYDQNIIKWFNGELPGQYNLRYGENPHQSAHAVINQKSFQQISGNKKLSYNNLLDLDSAIKIVFGFKKTFNHIATIVKHNTPCAYAINKKQTEAFKNALSGDPISSFGGIVVFNKRVEDMTAKILIKGFYEVIAAPDFSSNAVRILSSKKNLRVLKTNIKIPKLETRSIFAGSLHQVIDNSPIIIKKVSGKAIKKSINIESYVHVLKFIKSNSIAIFDGHKLVSQCGGQTSRIDALTFALSKFKALHSNNYKKPLYLLSDAFFPFEDSLKLIINSKLNITVFVPMGSINDDKIVSFAKKNKMNLYEINHRHFRH